MSLAIMLGSEVGTFTNWAIWGPLILQSGVLVGDTGKVFLSFRRCWYLKIKFTQMKLNK